MMVICIDEIQQQHTDFKYESTEFSPFTLLVISPVPFFPFQWFFTAVHCQFGLNYQPCFTAQLVPLSNYILEEDSIRWIQRGTEANSRF